MSVLGSNTEGDGIELRSGELLAGKYLLLNSLAVGGMGQVWTARNLTTDAEVAAKVLLPKHASPDGLARFRREARATAALSHRAIVRVFDLVELDPARGSLVMVMELLRGQTLCHRLEHMGALSVEETLEIAFPLLSALSHAHGLGIVHRDLKPENIFLALEPDGQRLPKIVDFGISKLVREHPITLDGQIVGTLNYMSPEQTLGGAVDARSDLFSLGVLLYECLSGRNPFVRTREGPAMMPDLLSVMQIEPPPLDHIPLPLWDVLQRALAKNVHERFASADEFARALAAAVPSFRAPTDARASSIPPLTTANLAALPRERFLSRGIATGAVLAFLAALGLVSAPSNAHSTPMRDRGPTASAVAPHPKRLAAPRDALVAFSPPDGPVFLPLAAGRAPRATSAESPVLERKFLGANAGVFGGVPARRESRIVLRDPGF